MRNWTAPAKRKAAGNPNCKHRDSSAVTWHETKISPQQGKPALGYVVVLERKTTTCDKCPMIESKTVQAIRPTESDLQHHFKGKAPASILRRLTMMEEAETKAETEETALGDVEPVEEVETEAEGEDQISAAFKRHGVEASDEALDEQLEDALADDDLEADEDGLEREGGEEDIPGSELPSAPLVGDVEVQGKLTDLEQPAEGTRIAESPLPGVLVNPGKDFWKNLHSVKLIQSFKKSGGVFPFTDASAMFRALTQEIHAVTGEHSADHLKAKLAFLSAGVTSDIEAITNFVKIIRNTSADWTPMACRLASEWGLRRLPNNDSLMVAGATITFLLFDQWLGVPHREVFSEEMLKLDIGEKVQDPTKVSPVSTEAAELLENLKALNSEQVKLKATPAIERAKAELADGIAKIADEVLKEKTRGEPLTVAEGLKGYVPKERVENFPVLGLPPGREASTEIPGTRLQLVNLTGHSLGVKMVLIGCVLILVVGEGPVEK